VFNMYVFCYHISGEIKLCVLYANSVSACIKMGELYQ